MVVKNEGTGKHEGLEKLMLKIGVFSSLYLVSFIFICSQGQEDNPTVSRV